MSFSLSTVLLLTVLAVGIAAAVIVVIGAADTRFRQERQTPEPPPAVTIPVQLIQKQYSVSPPRYYMTFVTAEGAVFELEVSSEAYLAFSEGEYGDLCVQGRQFLGFAPQALPSDMTDQPPGQGLMQ